jgi:hypothetical protein
VPRDLPGEAGRKKKRWEPSFEPDFEPEFTPDPSPVPRRVLALNKDIGRVVPTEITYSLAQSKLGDNDLKKASRFFAKQFDLSPADFFEPAYETSGGPRGEGTALAGYSLAGVKDPVTGEDYLSLRTARRLLESSEASIIEQWLQGRKATETTTDIKGNVTRGTPAISSKGIIDVLNHLTPLVGEDLSFGEAIGIASQVTNRKAFKQNLEVAMRTAFSQDRKRAITIALEAASRGYELRDVVDLAAFLAGVSREDVQKGVALNASDQDQTGNQIVAAADAITNLMGSPGAIQAPDAQVVKSGVGDLPVLGAMVDALAQRELSYTEAADNILAEMRVNQSDDKSLGELWIGATMKTLEISNRPLDAVMRVIGDPYATGFALRQPEVGPDGITIMGEDPKMGGLDEAAIDAWDILKGDQHILDMPRMKELGWADHEILIAELLLAFSIPAGAGAKAVATTVGKQAGKSLVTKTAQSLVPGRGGATSFLRLGGEVILDPLTGLGKVGRVTVGRKFLPLLDPEAQGRALRAMLYGKHVKLGNADIPTYLVRAAMKSDNPEMYFSKAVRQFRAEFSRDGIHPLLARSIFSWVKKGSAAGLDEDTLARGVREFFGDAMGVPLKADSLGNEIKAITENIHEAGRIRAASQAGLSGASEETLKKAYQAASRKTAQQLADQLDRVARDAADLGPIMHEVPKIKGIRLKPDGDGKVARAWNALTINALPTRKGISFNITPDLDPAEATDALDIVLTRSRVFNPQQIAEYRQRIASAVRPGFEGREGLISKVLDDAEADMLARIGKDLGVSPDDLESWTRNIFGRDNSRVLRKASKELGYDPDQVYAAGGKFSFEGVRKPLRPAQLQNNFGIIDPVYVRKAAKETMGYARELRAMAARAVGKDAPAASKALVTPSRIVGEVSRGVLRPALGLVKFGWVARPAYVLRIVAGDELLRFLGTEGLASRAVSGRYLARMAKARGVGDTAEIVLRTRLSEEDAITMRLPGLLADEPQAGQGAIKFVANSRGDILPPDIQRAFVDKWTTIVRGNVPDKDFNAAWWRALFQYGQDDTGRRMLRNFLDGMDAEANIDDVLEWHRTDDIGKSQWRRMRRNTPNYDVDEATRISVEYLDALMPDRQMADAILGGTLQPEDLGRLADEQKPLLIHGPALDQNAKKGLIGKIGGGWGRLILELPTNALIRQPFFKANYSTIYTFLREQALAAGKTIDDGMDAAFKAEAKRWSINRTQQVMFDFTRTGRLSELMWFVSPFFQPFTEFFLAWPKIIKQNPALVGYANHLARAAYDGGLFKEDEQTGEMVMPMTHFLGAAPLLAATTGGKLADTPGGGWELFAPVSSFNMFATNAYPYDFGGTEIPIPTPSFSPPVQWFLQYAIDKMPVNDDLKQDYMSWLTEFGEVDFTRPQDFAIPSWARHALTAAVPSWFDDQTNSNIQRFMALDQAMHEQQGIPWDREASEKRARGQSQAFGFMRAMISAFFPASPRISFPTGELEAEWDELVQQQDGNTSKALELWAGVFNPETGKYEGGLHPGLTRIALSKTMWDDAENPFPMPASEAAERILNSAGGKKFVERFPRWAFFIIPREIREGDFDLGAFFRQVSEGRRVVRSPEQANVAEDVANGWDAYFAIKTQWDAWQEANPDQTSGDIGYDHRQQIFKDQKETLAAQFPGWDAAWTMTIDTGVNPAVMQEARILVRSEEFTKTDGGKGLADYMEMRDALERDMAEANVSNLDTKLAARLGFTERYEKAVNELKAAHPDFEMMYDYLGFDVDLRSVVTAGQRALDHAAGFRPGMVTDPDSEHGIFETVINPWWNKLEKAQDAPYDHIVGSAERFAAYGELRDWQNTAYDRPDGINPMKLWWGTRNPEEQADYKASLANRSPIYWSRFDWEVSGVKQTKSQQKFWSDVDAARSEAFEREKTDPGFGIGAYLDRLDEAVAVAVEKNPALKRQLDIINDWTYGLEQVVLHPGKGRAVIDTKETKAEWKDIFDASQTVHDYMNRYGMTGASDYDPDLKTYYHQIKDALVGYIEKLKKDNPIFASQWEYLQDLSGTDLLIDTLMPESNYDLGVVDSGGTPAGTAHLGGRKLKKEKNVTLAPRPLKSLEQAQRQLGVDVLGHVEESYRTREEQAQRREAYENGTGNLAAEPGTSDHERGIAVDITSSFLAANPEVRRWLEDHGWVNNVAEEPWHWVFRPGGS